MIVAAVQLTSKNDKKKNLAVAKSLMDRAIKQGAELICLPEYFSFIGSRSELIQSAEKEGKGDAYKFCSHYAIENEVYILAGSIPTHPEKLTKDKKVINRSVLFDPKGKIIATYNKIHLFNTELLDARSYQESETFTAGDRPVVCDTPFGKVGFTVCYDLRFPELFRHLTAQGARIIFVPAAFTLYTGKDHWIPLLKARAIENQIYIIAPAQIGKHSAQKVSYGKSCIIDPWGNIVSLAPDCETVITADLDFKFLNKIRKELPVLKHIRNDIF